MQKILIADDSIAVRKVAERLLAEAGLGVVLAANGEEALAYLKKDCPDAIVTDVIMPGLDGPALYDWIERERTQLVDRIGFVTGDTLGASAERLRSSRGA